MNKPRRKEIEDVRAKLDELMTTVDTLASEERDYHDNMPEAIQAGEKGDRASEAADALEEAKQNLEDAIGNLETALQA
jgi:uncharacterized coiled-coil DUF342 family protein